MNPPQIPDTEHVPVLRCDFTDDERWARTWEQIAAATEDGFQNNVETIESTVFDGLNQASFVEMMRRLPDSYPHPVVFFADAITMSSPEQTLFVVWAWKDEYEGQFMRCLHNDVLAIENNVIDNLPWEEFYDAVAEDGVCRIV